MPTGEAAAIARINIFKALVPIVPVFLLLVVRRLIDLPPVLTNEKISEQAMIAAAMLIGVVCAGATSPRKIGKIPAAFFEGAGFTFAHVISIITAAAMFAEAIKVNGLIELMTSGLKNHPTAVTAASIVIPWMMACITGTAVGTAPLVINVLLPIAMGTAVAGASTETGLRAGALNAIAAQFGRTSSPVAPVVIMCATLSRKRPVELAWRVAVPLFCGGIALAIMALWRG
jgi:C4-dicarboxylate transporter